MGIFQGDVIIKTMVDLSIEEMRKNPWLLDQAFESLRIIPYISDKYGQNNIDACKEWFANNQIDVYLRPRNDKDRMPMVTIFPGGSKEKPEMKTMGDLSTETVLLLPTTIGKPIPYVVKPFTPTSYDPSTGEVGINQDATGIDAVSVGMVLVNPANGTGFIIRSITPNGVSIDPGIDLDATQLGIVPQHQFYEARVEHTFNEETYSIGCYAHGDPQALIWLHTIVYYAIMRYREVLLEGNGFSESVVGSGEVSEDPNFEGPGGEQAFCRFITITGQVENTWIKAPKRFIETMNLKDVSNDGISSGIKILSNFDAPPFLDPSKEAWSTIEETDDDGDEEDDQS